MKKMCKIFLMMLVTFILSTSGVVIAGDEQNPEIIDEEDDIFGPLIIDPGLFSRMKTLGRLKDIENFDFLDIVSAWFYENADEPDFLYSAVKLKNLEFKDDRGIYAMHWMCNGIAYGVGVHTYSNGDYQGFFAGESPNGPFSKVGGSFDVQKGIVTFRFPKLLIGYPSKGDVLTETDAWTALRFKFEPSTWPYGGELAKDWAGYGKDYTIQYESLGVPYMKGIYGVTGPNINVEYNYLLSAIDPDDDDLYYYIDWGDGTVDEWVGPYSSEEEPLVLHVWKKNGYYTIKAKAKDINGYESDWVYLDIYSYKSKLINTPLLKFLEKHPIIYKIVQNILKL